jgi:hypothetical protein
MTRHPNDKRPVPNNDDVEPGAHAEIEGAIDAVCCELGFDHRSDERRRRVAHGVVSTWRSGRRLPLNLVSAGFDAIGV